MSSAVVICVVNFKGGVGKTTTAVNLASYLADRGKRTLLVDMDPQASATLHLWDYDHYENQIANPQRTIAQLLFRAGKGLEWDADRFLLPYHAAGMTPEGDSSAPRRGLLSDQASDSPSVLPSDLPNLRIIAGDNRLIRLDRGLHNRPTLLDSVLNPLRARFDIIIIDSPPVMYSAVRNNILASDYYLVPTVPDHVSTAGIRHLLSTLASYFDKYATLIRDRRAELLGVLFTRFGGLNRSMHKSYYDRVGEDFVSGKYAECGIPGGRNPVLSTVIRERVDAARAAEARRPLVLFDRNSEVSVDYLRLAKEIEGLLDSEEDSALGPEEPTTV